MCMSNTVLKTKPQKVKLLIPCPICQARLCDAHSTVAIKIVADNVFDGTIYVKCHKCHNTVGLEVKR